MEANLTKGNSITESINFKPLIKDIYKAEVVFKSFGNDIVLSSNWLTETDKGIIFYNNRTKTQHLVKWVHLSRGSKHSVVGLTNNKIIKEKDILIPINVQLSSSY